MRYSKPIFLIVLVLDFVFGKSNAISNSSIATEGDSARTTSSKSEHCNGPMSDRFFSVLTLIANPDAIPISNGFDYPVGTTGYVTQANDGDGWYNAQDFGVNNHLGEDWNGEGGENTDCGLPVFSASSGTIVFAGEAGTGWGKVVIVRHQLANGNQVETLYGHLQTFSRTSGDVSRREQIGTIGDGNGAWLCHLHFELRLSNCPSWGSAGPGYASNRTGWTDPSNFIDANRNLSGVDVALVIDRSPSMVDYGYFQPAKTAASNFVGLTNIGDQIAVVSFSGTASVNFPLTRITSDATKSAARNAIAGIVSSSSTSIGAGMQAAQGQLNQGNTQVHQAMVLLSDGEENTPPSVATVLPTIPSNTDIYTIALGPSSGQALLNNIATQTGGFYSFAPDATGLQSIYNSIRAKVTGQQVIASFSGNILQGQTVQHTTPIDGSVSNTTFSVTWSGSDLNLELVAPNGRLITPDTAAIDPNITFSSGTTYEFYTVSSPLAGQWTLRIRGITVPTGGEPYNASAVGVAGLTMSLAFNRNQYNVGEPILVSATLRQGTSPVTGATVTADVQTPTAASASFDTRHEVQVTRQKELSKYYGTPQLRLNAKGDYVDSKGTLYYTNVVITLYDDGAHGDGGANDGVYANYFTNTTVQGSYTFHTIATGTAPTGGSFRREDTKSTVVVPLPPVLSETEPNNTASQANQLAYGDTVNATISTSTDVDYYRFTASAGDTVEVFASQRNNSQLYGLIMLFDGSGTLLDNSSYYPPSSFYQRVVYRLPSSGNYYARYSSRINWGNFPNKPSEEPPDGTMIDRIPGSDSPQADSGDYGLRLKRFSPSAPVADYVTTTNTWWNSTYFVGVFYPNGLSTTITFEYGTTTSYGNSVAATMNPYISLSSLSATSFEVSGLSPNTTYHCRLKAVNIAGIAYSSDYTFTTPAAPNGWVRQTSSVSDSWQGVSFSDARNGTAVAFRIIRTTNGGATWTAQTNPTTSVLYGVSFTDSLRGWAVGSSGRIIRTTNAGANWIQQTSGTTNSLYNVHFVNSKVGTAVGTSGTILRTTNGGANWNPQSSGTTSTLLRHVFFYDINNGAAVGYDGKILWTTTGGGTWVDRSPGINRFFMGVVLTAVNTGIVVGSGGTILRTTNGGVSWTTQVSGTTQWFRDVDLGDANNGVAVGTGGTIVRTTNGGLTWNTENSGTRNDLNSVDLTDASTGTAVGNSGTIIRRGALITWDANITVFDNCSGTGTLTFGLAPSATDGLDATLGEAERPPVPPAGVFDARFILPVTPPVPSFKDYRRDTVTAAVWRMTFQPGSCGYPITFTWNPSSFPANATITLRDEITGTIVNVNMKTQSSYTLTNSGIASLRIVYTRGFSSSVLVNQGWNMISVPLQAQDMRKTVLFPSATSPAYGYNNGYFIADTLFVGKAYWLKFNSVATITIVGAPISPPTIAVRTGWNMIGPLDFNARVGGITSTPPGIIQTPFYGYNNGYNVADTLKVGKGYWVKVSQNGTLHLSTTLAKSGEATPPSFDNWLKVEIEDNTGAKMFLYLAKSDEMKSSYELPPVAPAGVFDVRFSSNTNVEELGQGRHELQLSSAMYPVQLRAVNLNGWVLNIRDGVSGSLLNERLDEGKPVKILQNLGRLVLYESNAQREIPTSFDLSQNFPNPFNPTTVIKFALPHNMTVKLTVYNLLGEKVTELVNNSYEAGYHQVEFNGEEYASGMYLYKMEAGEFVRVKKMIILK